MNTQDFKPFIKSWKEIYALQGELQLMYRPYFKERIANFDINTLEDQELFKNSVGRLSRSSPKRWRLSRRNSMASTLMRS